MVSPHYDNVPRGGRVAREALRKRAEADAMSSLPTSGSVLAAQLQMTRTGLSDMTKGKLIPNPAELRRIMGVVPIELSAQ